MTNTWSKRIRKYNSHIARSPARQKSKYILYIFQLRRRDLKGQAGYEHVLDERRRRHQLLQLQVEDALQTLNAERTQLGQLAQQPAEVVVLALGLGVVGHVVA
jgi:hypothetical protein